jgi:hypothetical protein
MNKEYCEKVRLSVMAMSDGEQSQLPGSDINEHLLTCSECRDVIEQLQTASRMLKAQKRKSYEVNILDEIQPVIMNAKMLPEPSNRSVSFIILGFVLLILKIIDLSPVFTTEIIVKFASVFVVIVFFVLIRQNPFAINQNLHMKGD